MDCGKTYTQWDVLRAERIMGSWDSMKRSGDGKMVKLHEEISSFSSHAIPNVRSCEV